MIRRIPRLSSLAVLGVGAGVFVFLLSASVSRAAFKEPEAAPPGKNVAEPLNVGSTAQARLGPLRIGTALQSGIGLQPLQVRSVSRNNFLIRDVLTVSGNLRVGSSTAPALFVNSTGKKVGIGTASPTAKLTIAAGTSQALFVDSASSGSAILATTISPSNDAVYAESQLRNGIAILGENTDTTNTSGTPAENVGVYGESSAGYGVYGQVTHNQPAGSSYGVYGSASTSENDIGVLGIGDYGVSATGQLVGVQGAIFPTSTATTAAALYAAKPPVGANRYSVYAEGPTLAYNQIDRYAGFFGGPVRATAEVVAERFFPTQLPPSIVPFTNGQTLLDVTTGGKPVGLAFDGTYVWVAKVGSPSALLKIRASDGFVLATYSYAGLTDPRAVLFDGVSIWVADASNVSPTPNLFKIKPSDGSLLTSCRVSGSPKSLATDGTSIWVSNDQGLVKVDPGTCTVTGDFVLSPYPGSRSLVYDGTYLWVAARDQDAVVRFHPTTAAYTFFSVVRPDLTCATTFGTPTPCYRPNSVAFDGSFLWVGNEGKSPFNTTTRLTKLSTSGTVLKEYTYAQLQGIDVLLFDGINLWATGAAGDSAQSSPNGDLLQLRVTDGSLVSSANHDGSYGLAFDGSSLWSSQGTLGRVYKIFTGQGFGQTDVSSVLQLRPETSGNGQVGNAKVSGTFTVGGNAQVGDVDAAANSWGGLDDSKAVNPIGPQTTSCADGQFVTQVVTDLVGKVTSIVCRQL